MAHNNFFQQVYHVVRKIPAGKVATYGQIAKILGTRDARRVGHALHANPDRVTPCHRVVFADGRLAPSYAFGGPKEQMIKLELEGIVINHGKVDLKHHQWNALR